MNGTFNESDTFLLYPLRRAVVDEKQWDWNLSKVFDHHLATSQM